MSETNEMIVVLDSKSENERLARTVVAAFVSSLDPTIEELADIKTAVSEAVTNSIIHGYYKTIGKVTIKCTIKGNEFMVEVSDTGAGIADVKEAMEPLYTSKPELERSGMGFAFMEAFMDSVEVISSLGEGTTVKMVKKIKSTASIS